MSSLRESIEERVGPELASALEERGFEALTPVQEAVLKPELEGRDLRISSQTGSGKTVAFGFAVRASVLAEASEDASDGNAKGVDQRARPRAVIVVPTRELAKQVQEELAWLYAKVPNVRIASVTGGGGYRDELRAFRAKPAIIVGTPGRLLDHLKRGSIETTDAGTFVLDEADRMLDLGFREDIEAIFGFAPPERRTLLVSATFPREVKTLADRIQNNPVMVQGTPIGAQNEDIEHLLHLVHQEERLAAIINLLLEADGQTLIFARTRADVAELTGLLQDAGFSVTSLSGEMEQAERNRALAAFKRGNIDALVATDVAARGIDVNDVTRVIHAEPPTDADAYTHRSGRTGRAGKKGVSSVLVTPREIQRTTALLGRARVRFRFAPLPTAESLRDARDTNLFEKLTADFVEGDAIDERCLALAERILNAPEPARAIGRLVAYSLRQQTEARELRVLTPPDSAGGDRERKPRERAPNRDGWVRFRVSWGTVYGADHRRLMAMLCRRGNIEGRDIGAINLGRTSSVVEVSGRVAEQFERITSKPDPRDPKVHIRRWSDDPTGGRDDDRRDDDLRDTHEQRPAPRSTRALPDARPSAPAPAKSVPADRPSRVAKKSERALPEAAPSVPASSKSKRTLHEAPPSSARSRRSVSEPAESEPADRPAAPKSKRTLHEAPPSAAKSKRALPDAEDSAPAERVAPPSSAKSKRALPQAADSVPADRPSSRAASKRALPEAADSTPSAAKSRRAVSEAPASSPDTTRDASEPAAKAKKPKKKIKEAEVFTPREAVIRREAPKGRDERPPANTRDDRGPQRPWNDRGSPSNDRGPRPNDRGPQRPWNDRGPPGNDRGPSNDRGRPNDRGPSNDRGPRPNDRGPQRPWNDRGPRPNDRGPSTDRGPRPNDRPPREDRTPREDRGPAPPGDGERAPRGPAPNDRGGKPPWKKGGPPKGPGGSGGPRRDGPPPWERRGGNAPPKRPR